MGQRLTGYEPAIYVGDYASYNNGSLAGRWITLDGKSADEIRSEIAAVLKENEKANGGAWICEEPMIQDHQNLPSALYSECAMDYEQIVEYLELDDHERNQVDAYLDYSPDLDSALRNYEIVQLADCRDDLVDEYLELLEIPERLEHYIDRQAIEREMEIDGHFVRLDLDGSHAYIPAH